MGLMSVAMVSVLFIYFGQNTNLFISTSDLFNSVTDQNTIYTSVSNAVWLSHNKVIKKGYANNTRAWFENGPYPPTKEDYLLFLNQTLWDDLKVRFEVIQNTTDEKFIYDDFNLNYIVDENNETLYFILDNIYLEKNESNFYIKQELNFKFDFSTQFYIFNTVHKWGNEIFSETFNNIANSFYASCGMQCSCEELPNFFSNETGLNLSFIENEIEEAVRILNEEYFNNSKVSCFYEYKDLYFDDNYQKYFYYGGAKSFCEDRDLYFNYTEDASIWREVITDRSVIDSSTLSYKDTSKFNFIKRNLTIDSSRLNLIPIKYATIKEENKGVLKEAVVTSEKYEPGVSLKIYVSCVDHQHFVISNQFSEPLTSVMGYR
ncbi:hypothetical protein EOM09_07035, partial [bacterium]|nr:hypothetical protein [bacterium]